MLDKDRCRGDDIGNSDFGSKDEVSNFVSGSELLQEQEAELWKRKRKNAVLTGVILACFAVVTFFVSAYKIINSFAN